MSWTSSTNLSDPAKSLIAAFLDQSSYPGSSQASRPSRAGLPAGCSEAERAPLLPTRSLSSFSLPRLSSPALWLAYGSHFYLPTALGCCFLLCSN